MRALLPSCCSVAVASIVLAGLVRPVWAQGIKVNPPLPRTPGLAAEDVFAFQLSPDGAWTVYLADADENDRFELFSVPSDGTGSSRRLNPPLVPGGSLVRDAWDSYFGTIYYTPYLGMARGRVVYGGDQEVLGVFELFSVPIDGSGPAVKLNGPLDHGGSVWDDVRYFEASEPAGRVVYVAEQDDGYTQEIYSVPIDGGEPAVKLNASMVDGGNVSGDVAQAFAVSADGRRVVYRADQARNEFFELWSVPIEGGAAPVRLNRTLVDGGDVVEGGFLISPDGSRVVYLADQATNEVVELWGVPIDGATSALRLNAPLNPGGDVRPGDVVIAPDSTRVFYCADQELDGRVDLLVVPIAGGPSLRLAAPADVTGSVHDIRCSPDGERVVFRTTSSGTTDLWSVRSVGGSLSVLLSGPMVPGGNVSSFAIAGGTVVFTADRTIDDTHELWSVSIDGLSDLRRLNVTLPEGGDVDAAFQIAASGRVVYRADQRRDGVSELWSVPLDGSDRAKRLSGNLTRYGDVVERGDEDARTGFAVTQDGTRVVYRADQATDELFAIWSVPIDRSSAPIELNVALDPGPVPGDVSEFAWTPDGERLLYSADPWDDAEVHSALVGRPEVGPMPVTQLGDGRGIVVSPDGRLAAFSPPAWCEPFPFCTPSAPLWCRPIDSSASAIGLNPGIGGAATSYAFDRDGTRVVFHESSRSYRYSSSGLFSSDVLGAEPVSLTEPPGMQPESWYLRRFAIAPGGERVVYTYDHGTGHLVSVPIDRSLPPVELTPALSWPQDVRDEFVITPDERWVVLVADLSVPETDELFRVAIDGSGVPVPLMPALAAGRDVDRAFRVSDEGSNVVFVADLENDDVYELWSVPLDSAHQPSLMRLSAKPAPGGGVARGAERRTSGEYAGLLHPQFELAPGGSRVVYRADQEVAGVYELFSAPLDGRTDPVRLNAPLAPGQSVQLFGFRITSRGEVVYAADQDASDVVELYVAPLDGSGPPRKLSGSLVEGGDIWTHPSEGAAISFDPTPDGSKVVFLADRDADGTVELYVARIDGTAPPRRLNGTLCSGGDVASPYGPWRAFGISPDGSLVAYLADQDVDEVFELFVSYLDPPRIRPGTVPSLR